MITDFSLNLRTETAQLYVVPAYQSQQNYRRILRILTVAWPECSGKPRDIERIREVEMKCNSVYFEIRFSYYNITKSSTISVSFDMI